MAKKMKFREWVALVLIILVALSWIGISIYLFIEADRNSHSISDTLYAFLPNFGVISSITGILIWILSALMGLKPDFTGVG